MHVCSSITICDSLQHNVAVSILYHGRLVSICIDTWEGLLLFLEEAFAVFIELLSDAVLLEEFFCRLTLQNT